MLSVSRIPGYFEAVLADILGRGAHAGARAAPDEKKSASFVTSVVTITYRSRPTLLLVCSSESITYDLLRSAP